MLLLTIQANKQTNKQKIGAFEVIVIEAMCSDCASKRSDSCPHRDSVSTPWSSDASEKALKDVLGHMDRDSFNREVQGADIDARVTAFLKDDVFRMFEAKRHVLDMNDVWRPPCVFVAIDPTGGGISDVAIVSFFYTKDNRMIVSL